jgi:hypothetical protein
MATSNVGEIQIRRDVERLFGEISAKRGDLCENPVTGGEFVYGFDPIEQQKETAYTRLRAQQYFVLNGPPDAPLIPTEDYERSRAKDAAGLLGFISAQYIWSLEDQDDLKLHPSFADFASGLLWQHENNVGGCSLPYFPAEQFVELERRIVRSLTFRDRMQAEAVKAAAAEHVDPWRLTLERVRGKVDFFDGLERISSQTLLDLLEVPQRNRTAGTYRRLSKIMSELGWAAVRVRDLTRGGYKEQVRGYCREPRKRQPIHYS